jgi:hypothetical protein
LKVPRSAPPSAAWVTHTTVSMVLRLDGLTRIEPFSAIEIEFTSDDAKG